MVAKLYSTTLGYGFYSFRFELYPRLIGTVYAFYLPADFVKDYKKLVTNKEIQWDVHIHYSKSNGMWTPSDSYDIRFNGWLLDDMGSYFFIVPKDQVSILESVGYNRRWYLYLTTVDTSYVDSSKVVYPLVKAKCF